MKEKHGEYISLYWDTDFPPFEAVRGHVSLAEAVAEVNAQTGAEIVPGDVGAEHRYARWVPAAEREWDATFVLCDRGPGAFQVTLLHSVRSPVPADQEPRK